MKYILAVIVIFMLLLIIYKNYFSTIEEISNYKENKFLKSQRDYYDDRRFPSLTKGDKSSTNFIQLSNNNDKLEKTGSSKHQKKSEISKYVEECNIINKNQNCNDLTNTKCGFCFPRNKFMYGDKNGPLTDVCSDKKSDWTPPGVNSAYLCQKKKEQSKCNGVKNCGGSIGVASICGWCPTTQSGMVKKSNGKGGWEPKYRDDKCSFNGKIGNRKTTLINVSDCSKFQQQFPCMGPNWNTGPHNQSCLNKLWAKAGCTGNLNTQIPKSGLDITSELNKWNSVGFASVEANMKTYFKKTKSNEYNESKKYNMACLNKQVDPCQANFTLRPNDCDKKLWKESGCGENGFLHPKSSVGKNMWKNKKWMYNRSEFNGYPSQTPNSLGIVNSIRNKFNKLKSEFDIFKSLHKKKPTHFTEYKSLHEGCYGNINENDLPYKKPCWNDFTSKMISIGVRLPSSAYLDFSKASWGFKKLLKKTNSNQESNMSPMWFGNYRLKEVTYKLNDFPYWDFDVEFNKIKNLRWNEFKTKMLAYPSVRLITFRNRYNWNVEALTFDRNSRFGNVLSITTSDNTSYYYGSNNKYTDPVIYMRGSKLILTKWLFESFHFPYQTYYSLLK